MLKLSNLKKGRNNFPFSRKFKSINDKMIPSLNYGMLHCRFGDSEGVSIVMRQLEGVMNKYLKIPKRKIKYLVGTSGVKSWRITQKEIISERHPTNLLMIKNYQKGYGGGSNELIEEAILKAKKTIEKWINKNKIDVLIVHNSSHPVNFISSLGLSRYYRDALKKGKRTPKYVLWWHDSHFERKEYKNPPRDVKNYLLEGVPSKYVEHVLFINSLQLREAEKYANMIEKRNKGFKELIKKNHNVVYNTADLLIDKYTDLDKKFDKEVYDFLDFFKVKESLKSKDLDINKTLFVLQPTRIVDRKRIDFALEYSYALLEELKKQNLYQGIYFFVSGHRDMKSNIVKKNLYKLNRSLQKKYNTDKVILVFAEDNLPIKNLFFEDYPKIFAKLGGISTYFSQVEGFGNNLLEVLASGLIPVVYKYPVFKKDIQKFNFNLIAFDKYLMSSKKIRDSVDLLKNKKKRKKWVEENLKILKKNLSHNLVAYKLKQAIISKRKHF
ncbi:MAG: glycosyltransferase [Nanoarchaeota archaeon]